MGLVVPAVVEVDLADLDLEFELAAVEEVVVQVEPEPEAALVEVEAELGPSNREASAVFFVRGCVNEQVINVHQNIFDIEQHGFH